MLRDLHLGLNTAEGNDGVIHVVVRSEDGRILAEGVNHLGVFLRVEVGVPNKGANMPLLQSIAGAAMAPAVVLTKGFPVVGSKESGNL